MPKGVDRERIFCYTWLPSSSKVSDDSSNRRILWQSSLLSQLFIGISESREGETKSVYAHPNMEGRITDNPLVSRMPIDMHRPQVASMFVQSKKVGRAISKTTQLINYLFQRKCSNLYHHPHQSLMLFIIHFVKS